jgi:hypothetical protein
VSLVAGFVWLAAFSRLLRTGQGPDRQPPSALG